MGTTEGRGGTVLNERAKEKFAAYLTHKRESIRAIIAGKVEEAVEADFKASTDFVEALLITASIQPGGEEMDRWKEMLRLP